MSGRIIHKRSLTPGSVPTISSLETGELAINVNDGKIFLRRSGSGNNDVVPVVTANTITTGSITATSFTGSLQGTASWAISASQALTASYVNPLYQNVIITGSLLVTQSYISTVDYIDFNPNLPAGTPVFNTGRLHWVDDTKTLGLDTDVNGSVIELGHQHVTRVVNLTGATILKGRVVYITGSQGTRPGIATASYTDENDSATTLGFVMRDIVGSGGNLNGYVVTKGIIREVNTTGLSAGESLYLSSSGQYTTVKPQAPLHDVRLGKVIVGNSANAGVIYVDIQNGYEIDELHNVRIISASNGDLLTYSSSLWINTKQLSGSYGLTGSLLVSGSQIITGSFKVYDGTSNNIDSSTRYLYDSINNISVNWQGKQLNDSNGLLSIDWTSRALKDTNGSLSIDWTSRTLNDANGNPITNFYDPTITQHYAYSNKTYDNTDLESFSKTFNYAGVVLTGVTLVSPATLYDLVYLNGVTGWTQVDNTSSPVGTNLKLGIVVVEYGTGIYDILLEGDIVVNKSPGSDGPRINSAGSIKPGDTIYIGETNPYPLASLANDMPGTGATLRTLGHLYYQNQDTDTNNLIFRFNPSNDYYYLS